MFPFDFFDCSFLYLLLVSLCTHKLDTSTIVFHFAMIIYGKDSYIELLLTPLLKKICSSLLPMPCPTIFLIGKLRKTRTEVSLLGKWSAGCVVKQKEKKCNSRVSLMGDLCTKNFKGQEF